MQKTIKWTCPECKTENEWEMHKPNAHFTSMICDECGHETEGCLCDTSFSFFRKKGKLGGQKTKENHGKNYFKKLAEKRWKK